MIQGSLARRYAHAFVELAKEEGKTEEARKNLDAFAEIFAAAPDLEQVLCNRTIALNERKGILLAVLEKAGLSGFLKAFLSLLLDKERMAVFADIHRESALAFDEEKGILQAEIMSAAPLSESVKKELADEFSKVVGKKVDLDCKVDAGLIAGVSARIGHTIFDGTVTKQIERLKQRVLQQNKNA